LRYLEQDGIDYVLILSGDQLYRMDYNQMLKTHQESGADVTIAAVPITSEQAKDFGIMRLDDTGRVKGFLEKPKTKEDLDLVRTDPAWIDAYGVPSHGRDCLASMGIYLFNRNTLVELLRGSDYADFGKEVFPLSIRTRKVQTHLFDGYWEDIGTIKAFYDANLALTSKTPPFKFVDADAPIYTHARFLPPTRVDGAHITGSLIADGCEIDEGADIQGSVIGLRYKIGKNANIKDTFLMGADRYEYSNNGSSDLPPIGVGEGSKIEGAIIDKNCRIGKNVTIRLADKSIENADFGDKVVVRDGVIVVKKDAVLPDGWSM
jgi:glucose-1-phosphate adenylyltransferase